MQKNVRLSNHTFSDLRDFTESDWSRFRSTLVRIVNWFTRNQGFQFADVENVTQEIILKLFRLLRQPNVNLGREQACLRSYVFSAVRNCRFDHFRKKQRSREILAGDRQIDITTLYGIEPDLSWVTDGFVSLKPEYRDRLEQDIFGNQTTLEIARGSKKVAN